MNARGTFLELRSVGIFTGAYLLIASYFALQSQNWEFVYYIAVVLLLAVAVTIAHRRIGLTQGVLWCLSIWGLLHMVGGLVPIPASWPINGDKRVFYSLWFIPNYLKYDQVLHAYGFGVSTWVCWQGVRSLLKMNKPTGGVLFLCALGGMGLGAFNEIVEFVAVLVVPETNVGGYINTGWDLVANMVGCAVAAMIIKSNRHD